MVYQVPEWEGQPSASSSKARLFTKWPLFTSSAPSKEVQTATATQLPRSTLRQRLDRLVPPHCTYFGRSRRTFLLVILASLLILLALILGLSIGLSRRKSSPLLPLPTNAATFTGDLTFYATGLGACGITSSDSDAICAISMLVFDAVSTSSNTNNNPLCGRRVRVVHFDARVQANKSIDLTVVDRCVACQADDLDLSYSAFDYLADRDLGRVKGEWAWLS